MQPSPPSPPASPDPAIVRALTDVGMPAEQARNMAEAQAAVAGQQAAATQPVRAAPRTAQDIAGLREQRRELSNQLTTAQNRREDVARALERAHDPVNQNGLQARLRVLDGRIAQLEGDIASTGQLITSAPPAVVGQTVEPRGFLLLGRNGPSPNAVPALLFVVIALQLFLLARFRGRRTQPAATPDRTGREVADRLARVEQAVDAIAVEVERVSEGQRFVTRLLAESRDVPAPALARPEHTLDAVGRQG